MTIPAEVQRIVDGLNAAIILLGLYDKAQILWELDLSGFVLPVDQKGLDEDLEAIEKMISILEGAF